MEELPKEIRFDAHVSELKKPFSFLVGESLDGLIVAHLSEIHHMLVAGSTGGGKSVFFKQALVGLLKSSDHIQLYLLDLKRGVDMKPFEELKNVRIAKDMLPAVSLQCPYHSNGDGPRHRGAAGGNMEQAQKYGNQFKGKKLSQAITFLSVDVQDDRVLCRFDRVLKIEGIPLVIWPAFELRLQHQGLGIA